MIEPSINSARREAGLRLNNAQSAIHLARVGLQEELNADPVNLEGVAWHEAHLEEGRRERHAARLVLRSLPHPYPPAISWLR